MDLADRLIDRLFAIGRDVRYVAVYRGGDLTRRSREDTEGTSSDETDRYEELLVNPTLLKLAAQRGDIDCGGLDYLLIRYGNFYQYVEAMPWGHLSVCLDQEAPVHTLIESVRAVSAEHRTTGSDDPAVASETTD